MANPKGFGVLADVPAANAIARPNGPKEKIQGPVPFKEAHMQTIDKKSTTAETLADRFRDAFEE